MTPSEWFELTKTIFSAVGAVGAAVAAYYGIRSKKWGRAATAYAAQAAENSSGANINSGLTNATVDEFKRRFDDVYAALLAERLQETRVRRVEDQQTQILTNQTEILTNQNRVFEFMAGLEQERHDQDRAVITGTHFLDRQEQ